MPGDPIHVLVVDNGFPLPASVSALADGGRIRVTAVRTCGDLTDETVGRRVDAALVIDADRDRGRRVGTLAEAARLAERLNATRAGLLVMRSGDGAETPDSSTCDFLETVRLDITPDELWGRLSTIAHYRPMIQQLERELSNMQRLGKRLNRHFSEIDQEMRLASRLQRDFLPHEYPVVGGVRFSSLFRPASWVSGDIYDVFRVDEHHVGLYVADAVGHGMAAGLLTMFIKRAIVPKRIFGEQYEIVSPGGVLAALNDSLKTQNLPNCQFVTACYCLYNITTRRLQVARGGHPYPIRIGKDGSLTEIRSVGGLLGVFPGEEYETVTTTLNPGEKLVLYSDGIEVAFLEQRTAPDSEPRYRKEFEAVAHLPANELISHLGTMLDEEEGSLNPHDDVTVIALEVGPDS